MHPVIKQHFATLFARFPPGRNVLEVGANARSARELSIELPGREYTGVNMLPEEATAGDGWRIVPGTGNQLEFADGAFDAVVCNAVLEHDASFWLTLGEMRRVLKSGGLCYLSVPAFSQRPSKLSTAMTRLDRRLGYGHWLTSTRLFGYALGTSTFPFHAAPHDYYRFSPQAVREVLLDGYEVLALDEVHIPPRAVGVGRKV